MAFSAHKNEEDIKEHFDDRAVVLEQVRAQSSQISLSLSLSLSLSSLILLLLLQPFSLSIPALRLLSLLIG